MDLSNPWVFLLVGYPLTILIETTVLVVMLARRHPMRTRLVAGVWLTACTYPVVVLVLPPLLPDYFTYLLVAETFAPVAECVLFLLAFGTGTWKRDCLAITLANLLSFGLGKIIF